MHNQTQEEGLRDVKDKDIEPSTQETVIYVIYFHVLLIGVSCEVVNRNEGFSEADFGSELEERPLKILYFIGCFEDELHTAMIISFIVDIEPKIINEQAQVFETFHLISWQGHNMCQ